jgi:hypothetical protein
MAETPFLQLYASDALAVYALWIVPALFLAWLCLSPAGRGALASPDRDVRFVALYCAAFAVETIVDPFATGPLLRRLGASDGGLGTAVLVLFVLLGDFRVFLLLFRIAEPARPLGSAARDAALWTAIVPLVAFATDRALREALGPDLPAQTIWLVYELAFFALALWLRQVRLPAWLPHDAARRRALQAIAAYVALYYGLWATADVIVLAGFDFGWLLRLVPNQLYYGLYLPFVYFQLVARSATATSQSTQASR